MTRRTRIRAGLAVALALYVSLFAGPGGASVAAAPSYALIQGSGSSWAANAVNQWVADGDAKGLKVVYTANGAAQGRKDYANKSTDFGVTDSPYRGKDPTTGATDSPLGRSFAYLPIVSGGTSFPYHVEVGGQMVRNLRLSGDTIAKIFTNQIDNWNDAAITKDNNGRALPSIPIIPVVRADGAGITNQFTTWMVSQHASLWKDCNGGKLAPTDYFPVNCGQTRGQQKAQAGSDGVMNYVKSKGANGAIAMEEYSYPLMANFPVAKVLNKAGYYTLPTQYNVAVALTAAEINNNPKDPEYLTQKLDRVYVNADKRTYPLSSYVYAIIPTAANDSRMTTAKRQTIVDFLKQSICEGQSEIGPIGYSPLPINLVQAGFTQVNKLKLADQKVQFDASIITNVKNCHNPTFVAGKPHENHLAKVAPFPAECDRPGKGPCAETVGSYNENPDEDGDVPADAGNGGGGGGGGNGGGTATPTAGATASPGATPTATGGGAAPAATDTDGDGLPDAPQAGTDPAAGEGGVDGATAGTAAVVATTLDADAAGSGAVLKVLVVGLFLGALVVPVTVGQVFARRRGRR
ncbi:substrate-binding domain-containing protein [Nocardioides lianchengensis]|uniref:ABC-type phosphate transport system, substrate-binding protein n=1 Tax=Nocardioides lianchengensis TaxID=1045774 RepID=A0A1G6TI89_9ACTN|nr:substrate-binding domain-containing protein [Nocardioides lianchengensis]NYG11743.1 ABC-type phosphate transport system substrate-binding protein [Nocardioides lianchengensis]SDD28882.1 ABC-type phosphate transport system, substrate-binding protein [Nocardioides lianchengensis]